MDEEEYNTNQLDDACVLVPLLFFLFIYLFHFFSYCRRGFCGSAITTNGFDWPVFEVAAAPRLHFTHKCCFIDFYTIGLCETPAWMFKLELGKSEHECFLIYE